MLGGPSGKGGQNRENLIRSGDITCMLFGSGELKICICHYEIHSLFVTRKYTPFVHILTQTDIFAKYKENPLLVFSGDREIPTRGSTVPVGNEALPSFPLERWTRGLGFPDSTVHQ